MLKFTTVQKHWKSVACLEGLPQESFLSLSLTKKGRTWLHSLSEQITNKTFGQARPKWECLSMKNCTMCVESQTQHISKNINIVVDVWWFGVCFTATGSGHVTASQELSIAKSSSVKYETICPTATVKLYPHAIWQLSDAKHQIYSRMTGKKRRKIKVLQWLSQSPEWAAHKQMPQTSLNWSNAVRKRGPKFFYNDVKGW